MINKIKQRILHNKKILYKKFSFTKQLIGYLLIAIGENLIHRKRQYSLICSIIEESLHSDDVRIKVEKTYQMPLYIRFQLKVIKPDHYDIDGSYFRREIASQLGCELSDIDTSVEDKTYYLDITRTALGNLEKGCTPYVPQAYHADFYDEYLEKAKKIVIKHKNPTVELLQEELDIGYARACRIMDELEEIGVLSKVKKGTQKRKLVN